MLLLLCKYRANGECLPILRGNCGSKISTYIDIDLVQIDRQHTFIFPFFFRACTRTRTWFSLFAKDRFAPCQF